MRATPHIPIEEIQGISKNIMQHFKQNNEIANDPEILPLLVEAGLLGRDVFKDYLSEHDAWDFAENKPLVDLDKLAKDVVHIEGIQLEYESEFLSNASKRKKVVESETCRAIHNIMMEINEDLRGLVISYMYYEINKEYGYIYKNVVPPEIIWLMLSLAGTNNNKVLCPFVFSETIGIAASSIANNVYNMFETDISDDVPYQNVSNVSYIKDSLFYQQKNSDGESQYDTTFAVLPQMRVHKNSLVNLDDRYKSTSYPVQGLNKILSCTKEKAVVLISKDFLTSSGVSEFQLKERLLKENLLDMVIELPDSTIPDHKTNYSIIVLNKHRNKDQNILFFDASENYSEPRKLPYKHNLLTGWKDVLYNIENNQHQSTLSIPASDPDNILADFDFSPKRHIYLKSYLQTFDSACKPLEKIAHLMRGYPLVDPILVYDDEDISDENSIYYEASIKDIGPYNILRQPEKKLQNVNTITKKRRELILKPNDILLSIKGIVGHVALVPDMGNQKWIPNQSFQIIRVHENYDPIALFYLLKSPKLQHMISIRQTGTTINQIKVDDLKALPIPIITQGEINKANELHNSLIDSLNKIEDNFKMIHNILDL